MESGAAVPLGAGEVNPGTAAALAAPVPRVEGLERGRALEVDGLEVVEQGLPVIPDRRADSVGAALEQPAHGLVPSVPRVQGDAAARDVDPAGEVPHGGDRVAPRVDLDLAEDPAGSVRDRCGPSSAARSRSARRRRGGLGRPWRAAWLRRSAGPSTGRWRDPGSRTAGRRRGGGGGGRGCGGARLRRTEARTRRRQRFPGAQGGAPGACGHAAVVRLGVSAAPSVRSYRKISRGLSCRHT